MKIKIIVMSILFGHVLLANSSVFAAGFAYANEEVTEGDIIAEWLVRPAGALGTVAGIATFFAGLPFSVMADNTEESFDVLVREPFKYTFHRPVGHYSAEGNY
ncbi:MAG: hypothetical protein QM479_00770 [Pseudomonadota bacterium]